MRWYPIPPSEARVLGCPSKVDDFGSLALSLDCGWNAERPFMIVTAYADETGIEGPRAYMAGYVSRVSDWHGFSAKWQKLLDDENIPYSHIMEMRKGDPPFEGWDDRRIDAFLKKSNKIIRKYCVFGQTVAVDLEVHRNAYRKNMPEKTSPDSVYGMCSRVFFEMVPQLVERFMGLRHVPINFILERHEQHFGDAERIFHDLKKYEPVCKMLGTITPGDYTIAGLQAADALAFMARRKEEEMQFSDTPPDRKMLENQRKKTGECPIMHVAIDEDAAPAFHRASEVAARLTRWDAAKRKKAKKGERA